MEWRRDSLAILPDSRTFCCLRTSIYLGAHDLRQPLRDSSRTGVLVLPVSFRKQVVLRAKVPLSLKNAAVGNWSLEAPGIVTTLTMTDDAMWRPARPTARYS